MLHPLPLIRPLPLWSTHYPTIVSLTSGVLQLVEVPHEVRVGEDQFKHGLHITRVHIIDDGPSNMFRTTTWHLTYNERIESVTANLMYKPY